jgi:hypothetical protein
MAQSVFKHLDDKGDLSMFASSEALIVSCSEGHYWVLTATPAESKESVGEVLSRDFGFDISEGLLRAL